MWARCWKAPGMPEHLLADLFCALPCCRQGYAWDEVLCDWYKAKEENNPKGNWAYGRCRLSSAEC